MIQTLCLAAKHIGFVKRHDIVVLLIYIFFFIFVIKCVFSWGFSVLYISFANYCLHNVDTDEMNGDRDYSNSNYEINNSFISNY